MADDPNQALRAELTAALAVIEPQIRGLQALLKFPISSGASDEILNIIDVRVSRRILIMNVIKALDEVASALNALQADGYPALNTIPVLASIEREIQQDLADLEAAVAVFVEGQAETGDFNPERSIDHE